MPSVFRIEVVAADHKVFTGDAVSVTIPGIDGYFGVLRGHAPLVSAIAVGVVTIRPTENREPIVLAVSGGFTEVTGDHVVILADSAELTSEIDIERARIAKARADERLRVAGTDIDVDRAKLALLRAINRLKTIETKGI